MSQGRRWTVTDARGNPIYLTEERWEHIRTRHPDLAAREKAVRDTIRKGRRHQDARMPAKYFYRYAVEGLPGGATHIVAVVLFCFEETDGGAPAVNNYVTTAYPKEIG